MLGIIERFAAIILLAFSPVLALAQSPSPASGAPDLYFLAVGAANHQDDDVPGFRAARYSTELVARTLHDAGARFGILLTSDPEGEQWVTREDFFQALLRLQRQIREDGSETPRIVVYIMSHGVADEVARYSFMLPDNLIIDEDPIGQEYAFRLAKRAITDIDILAALMSFRLDDRLAWLDGHLQTDLYSDMLGLRGILDHTQRQGAFSQELDRRSSTYGSAPFNNAPVPFVVLMDNCTAGFDYRLSGGNDFFDLLAGQMYAATLNVGRAIYAVPPGQYATTRALPDTLERPDDRVAGPSGAGILPSVGPLAIHLRNVLKSHDGASAMTLQEFSRRILHSPSLYPTDDLPEAPFHPDALLRPDVASTWFIPSQPGKHSGIVNRIEPSLNRAPSLCCRNIN